MNTNYINQTKFDLSILSNGTYQPNRSIILSHSREIRVLSAGCTHTLRGSRQITYSPMTLYQTSKPSSKLLRNPTGACLNRGTIIGTCCQASRGPDSGYMGHQFSEFVTVL